MKLDDFNHEFPRTPDAGLHLWVGVVVMWFYTIYVYFHLLDK